MKFNDLCDVIARSSGIAFSEVQLYGRRLREAGFLPQGSTGRSAPPIQAEHAANLLIGLMATSVGRQAPEAMSRYREARRLLAEKLSDPEVAKTLIMIRLKRGTRSAMFWYWDMPEGQDPPAYESVRDRNFPYLSPELVTDVIERTTYDPFEVNVELRGDVIVRVAEALAADAETDGRRR